MTRSLWVLLVFACKPEPDPVDPDDDPPDTDTEEPTTETAATGSTGDTSTTATGDTSVEPIIDCAAIPVDPVSFNQLDAPRGYHDVAFDALGNIIGLDGNTLIQVSYYGDVSVFLAGTGTVQGMDWLPDGDLVIAAADTGSLVRVSPAGGASVLASSGGNYGVTVGPDGMVYTADYDRISRYDPATGDQTTILDRPDLSPKVIDFSPDHSLLYIGTSGGNGSVYALPLDVDLNPSGPPTVFATNVGAGTFHDGLAVDWCGNVYVLDFSNNNLYKITPAGVVETFVDFSGTQYGHGLEWGSGIGGWRTDALYFPQPYNGNRVAEIVIGVPSREWTGTVWPPE